MEHLEDEEIEEFVSEEIEDRAQFQEKDNARAEVQEEDNEKDIDIVKPYIGMTFDTEEDAYDFYNIYAKSVGFSVRRDYFYKSRKTNQLIARMLVCSKEGHKDLKRNDEVGRDVKRRRNVREGCGAMLFVKNTEHGKWEVQRFEEKHTHPLISPSDVLRLRSHHEISSPSKQTMTDMRKAGIGPSKIAKFLKVSGEKFITSQHCIDHIRTTKKDHVSKECMTVLSYFEKKLDDDEAFFFRIVANEKDVAKSFFWADGRSQDNYMTFGDVIVFDTTYRTNKFKMPFAPFTGVNHHRQSILLGCALLANETEDTFVWLFETWLECMNGKQPTCIITDQDIAMGNAIRKVFPNARHMFCIWHIFKNAMTHLRDLYARDNFRKEYNDWYFGSSSIEEFEENWLILKQKYDIANGHWLEQMYQKRHHWVPIYLSDTFCAGMQSTQRSESINAFFDGFVNSNTSLDDFVHQYDLALSTRREAEEREDFKNLYSLATPASKSPLEIYAGKVYTQKIFSIFQEEFKKIMHLWSHMIWQDGEKFMYSVYVSGEEDKQKIIVEYNAHPNISVKYICKMFEQEGILCSHALLVLNERRSLCLPEQYVLHRWTMNARYSTIHMGQDDERKSNEPIITPLRKLNFKRNWRKVSEMSLRSPDHLNVGFSILKEAIQKLSCVKISDDVDSSSVDKYSQGSCVNSQFSKVVIHDPAVVKSKGRPRNIQRLKSNLEVSISQSGPKKRTCSYCLTKGHYVTSCPLRKAQDQQRNNIEEEPQ